MINKRFHTHIGLLAALAVTVLMSCDTDDGNSASLSSIEKPPLVQTVEVVKPIKRSINGEVLITGTAKANQQVMLYAMESGYVQSVRILVILFAQAPKLQF